MTTLRQRRDDGFSLPEVMVAMTLIVIALSGFAVVYASLAVNYTRTIETQNAESLLADEMAYIQALPYADIITQARTDNGAPEPCNINPGGNPVELAVPAVEPESTAVRDGVTYTISRTVQWYTDPETEVACIPGTPHPTLEASDDIKVTLLTVTWTGADETSRSRTIAVYASPYTYQGVPAEVLP